jgi:hypothetical protein
MACDCTDTIQTLIDADKKYVTTCCWIYGAVATVSIILTVCLSVFVVKNNNLTSLAGLLANGLAFPLVPKHLQRARALTVMEGLRLECNRHAPEDPPCKRIAEAVDAMLRAVTGAV